MNKVFLIASIFYFSNGYAQTTSPCSAPESSQFDFWVGDWNLTYNDSLHSTNKIDHEFDGCVIHEHFFDPNQKYKGESWSVFNPNTKMWQQTWVDNQGAYIALNGKFENSEMLLFTEPHALKAGGTGINKMRYYNITDKSFDWNWEQSTDNGKTWTIGWKIHYVRK